MRTMDGWRIHGCREHSRGRFGPEGSALLGALLRLAAVELRLRREGFRRMVERAPMPVTTPSARDDAHARAGRYAGLLERASRVPFLRGRCLQRSLALHLWLRGEGLASDLRIGVRKDGGALRAHAWVELGGQVVNDHPAAVAAFTPIFSTGADRAHPVGAAGARGWSPAWS
jgi:hypothetical protein